MLATKLIKNTIFTLLIIFLLSSCYQEHKEEVVVPEKLLSEKELVDILTDLQLAEAVLTQRRLQKITSDKEFKDSVYNLVIEHYNLTLDELTDNLNYYNADPQHMEILYEDVLSNLSKIQSEVELAAKNDTLSDESIEIEAE